jgi:hypothetical protein
MRRKRVRLLYIAGWLPQPLDIQQMKKHAAPIIAAILLLLPVLYVGSYLAMVVPQADVNAPYRIGGTNTAKCFWPLEMIDRRLRPKNWDPPAEPTTLPVGH